ncbi:MAG: hypothetical protein GOP50_06910 [Candidatus Heimdallarchaeota archaeon]|nr:hypothetical protein [Candidatus Heimdallarchaeota archaeon]
MNSFFPEDKKVPKELVFNGIKIRQLRSTDNELDYQAAIESGFRPEGFPEEVNLEQIAKHELDHNNRIEFAYTILDEEETVCYGCIFVKPISPFLKFAFFNDRMCDHLELVDNDAAISFWITPTGWNQGYFIKILEQLIKWFKNDWPYEKLFYLGMRPSEKEFAIIEEASLEQRFLLQLGSEQYVLWQLY